MLRCNEPAPPIISSALRDPTQIRDAGQARRARRILIPTLITPHHSQIRGIWLLFFLESEQAKVTLFYSSLLYVSWRRGWRRILSRCEKIRAGKRVYRTIWATPPILTYFLPLQTIRLMAATIPGYMFIYIFWEGGILVWPLVSGPGRECAELCWDCVGVGIPTVYNLCCLWNMMMDLSTRDGCNTR